MLAASAACSSRDRHTDLCLQACGWNLQQSSEQAVQAVNNALDRINVQELSTAQRTVLQTLFQTARRQLQPEPGHSNHQTLRQALKADFKAPHSNTQDRSMCAHVITPYCIAGRENRCRANTSKRCSNVSTMFPAEHAEPFVLRRHPSRCCLTADRD